jgi:hypothetical protein
MPSNVPQKLTESVSSALAEIEVDTLLELLRKMDAEALSYVMRFLGLRRAATVNRGMASALLANLRSRPSQELLAFMFIPLDHVFTHTDLTTDQWTDLLSGDFDRTVSVLEADRAFTWHLLSCETTIPPGLHRAALAVTAVETVADVPPIAFLAQHDFEVAGMYEALRAEYPGLPESLATLESILPRNLAVAAATEEDIQRVEEAITCARNPYAEDHMDDQVGEHANPLWGQQGGTDQVVQPKPAGDHDTGAGHAHQETIRANERAVAAGSVTGSSTESAGNVIEPTRAAVSGQTDLDDPSELLAAADALDWGAASETAERVADALRHGDAPELDDVSELTTFTIDTHRVAAALTRHTDSAIAPSLDEIYEALVMLRETSDLDDVLLGLVAATGPADLAPAIQEVRQIAARSREGQTDEKLTESLIALAQLSRVVSGLRAGTETEYGKIAEFETRARAALPPAALPAVTAALLGALTVPDASDVRDQLRTDTGDSAAVVGLPGGVGGEATDAEPADSVSDIDPEEGAPRAAQNQDLAELGKPVGQAAEASIAEAGADAIPGDGADPSNIGCAESAGAADPAADVAPSDAEDAEFDLAELDDFLRSPDAGSLRIRRPTESASEDPHSDAAGSAPVSAGQGLDNASAMPSSRERRDATALAEEGPLPSEFRDTEAALLAEGRFGLASLLHTDESSAAARRLAAYQAHLTSATGPLASAFAEDQHLISRDALADDRVGQLLAWASAARVAVLAPASGAASVLAELAPSVENLPNLTKVGQELMTASLGGAIALPEHTGDVSASHDAAAAAHGHVSQARELLELAPRRAVKYAPANNVYQRWMASDGILGSLLGIVIINDPGRVDEVRSRILDIRRTGERRLIDDTFQEVRRSGGRGNRIEAGARHKLGSRIEEVLDVASGWADASASATELGARIRGAASASRPLDKLRSNLESLRSPAMDELRALRVSCDQDTAAGRQEAAAVDAVSSMLVATFATCTGHPPQGAEPSAEWAVNSELLGADLSLDPETLLPFPPVEAPFGGGAAADTDALGHSTAVDAALFLAGSAALSFEDLYQRRHDRAEHDLTEVIIINVSLLDPEVAAPLLRARRDADVSALQPQVTAEVDFATDEVNSRRRDETLPEGIWSSLLAQLEGLRDPQRRDFAAIRVELDRIRAVVDDHKHVLMQQARARIEKKAAEDLQVSENRETLLSIVDRGDVSGADEFLEQLTSGQPLPETRHDDVHLQRFFPAVPGIASRHANLLPELQAALAGREPSAGVRELSEAAHVDPTGHAGTTRTVGQAALGAWMQLASRPKDRVDVGSALKPILAAMGLEFSGGAELDKNRPAGRQLASLRGVDGAGNAMSPVLGSSMGGPGGDSLRVLLIWQKDTSPTTMIDWLREVPSDRTALVLVLTGTLGVEQRRALATAARGHKRPVAIVVDAALMAYLACQAVPSRMTLAFLTLPFTADSPYADRPGNTPVEMFYGRVGERQKVVDLAGPSFMSGGRQLGKSALLRSAEREFNRVPAQRALWVDIRTVGADGQPESLWPMLDAELRRLDIIEAAASDGPPTAKSVSEDIRTWLRHDSDRALLILVDEADNFLTADAEGNKFTNVGACKRLMEQEDRRVKFVFAGLHRTSRFESLSNQPLAHMGKPIVVGPLRPQAAQDLITRPLSAMGFTFSEPTAQTARILAATNSVPSLLQLFGRAMMEHLTSREIGDGPPQQITDEDIATVLDDRELATEFREKYVLTLNLDHRYQVIVHAVALAAYENGVDLGLRLDDLAKLCRQYWPAGFAELPIDYLRGLVTECCDLGLLTLDQGSYRMRTPYVLRLLGTADEVAEVLFSADQRLTLPTSLDAGSYRARLQGGNQRAPLTARQVGLLLEATGKTRVIVGNEALNVQRALPSLEHIANEGRSGGMDIKRLPNLTRDGLLARVRMLTKATMLVLDVRSSSPSQVESLLAASDEAHAAASDDLTLVMIAHTCTAPGWLAVSEKLVELVRVDAAGLRLWCEEVDAPFHTPEELRALGAATGGWPLLIERTLSGSGPASSERCLVDLQTWLASSAGALTFVTACGLGESDQPLLADLLKDTFAAVAEWTAGDSAALEVLAELLADEADLAQRATEAGFDNLGEVLRTLQLGGMLVTEPGSTLVAAEPVLAAAVRQVIENGQHSVAGGRQ